MVTLNCTLPILPKHNLWKKVEKFFYVAELQDVTGTVEDILNFLKSKNDL